jgi:hypothetical protein
MNHHRALGYCLNMIFSENRFALFRIMRQDAAQEAERRRFTGCGEQQVGTSGNTAK